jgi:hypothetical protein
LRDLPVLNSATCVPLYFSTRLDSPDSWVNAGPDPQISADLGEAITAYSHN